MVCKGSVILTLSFFNQCIVYLERPVFFIVKGQMKTRMKGQRLSYRVEKLIIRNGNTFCEEVWITHQRKSIVFQIFMSDTDVKW